MKSTTEREENTWFKTASTWSKIRFCVIRKSSIVIFTWICWLKINASVPTFKTFKTPRSRNVICKSALKKETGKQSWFDKILYIFKYMIEICLIYVTYVSTTSSPVASGKCDELSLVTFAGWVKELLLRCEHDTNCHDVMTHYCQLHWG